VKVYINKVVFMAEGEEIVVGTGVSANELMEQAKTQGLNVTGYGGGGAPQQGFDRDLPRHRKPSPSPGQFGTPQQPTAPFPSNPLRRAPRQRP